MWPSAKLRAVAHVQHLSIRGRLRHRARGRRNAEQRPAVQLDDAGHRGRLRCEVGVRELHEAIHGHLGEHRVEAPLEAERGRRLGRHPAAAERAGDVPGEELDAVVERAQPLVQGAVERSRALVARHREVGPPAVADEQRVAGQDEPRLVAARAVGDDDAAVLRAVPGRVEDVERDVAHLDAIGVAQRPVLVDGVRDLVDRDPAAVLLGEDPVPRDVIGMRMGLDHPDELGVVALAQREHLAHVQRRVDHDGLAGDLAAHEIRGAAQVAPDDLLEDHSSPSPRAITRRWISFVPSPISRILASR